MLSAMTCAPCSTVSSVQHQECLITVEGRITRKRWFSSKLLFFDLSSPTPFPSPLLSAPRVPKPVLTSLSDTAILHTFVGEQLSSAPRLACIYRQGALHDRGVLSAADVVQLASEIECGDWVRVCYVPHALNTARGERSVQVTKLQVIQAWSMSHPNTLAWDSDSTPPPLCPVEMDPNTRRAPKGEICKFWVNSGRCPLHACSLMHVDEVHRKAARQNWQDQRNIAKEETQRKQAAAIGDYNHVAGKQHKKNRASIFSQWLADTYGLESLKKGSGVFDIAGGKGEVSDRLQQLGVRSTVVDPRQQSHEHIAECFDDALWRSRQYADLLQECSMLVGMHPDQATEPIIDFAIAHRKPFAVVPCCVFPRLHFHRRKRLAQADWAVARDGEGVTLVGGATDTPTTEEHSSERQRGQEEDCGGSKKVGPTSQGVGQEVGEDLGDLVITYEDFLEFLRNKHPAIQQTCLGFKGRNAVLYVIDYPGVREG